MFQRRISAGETFHSCANARAASLSTCFSVAESRAGVFGRTAIGVCDFLGCTLRCSSEIAVSKVRRGSSRSSAYGFFGFVSMCLTLATFKPKHSPVGIHRSMQSHSGLY